MDVLQQYSRGSPAAGNPIQHFDEVANHAPPDLMGDGIAEALRSDQTPPLQSMVGQLFGQSNPQQRAGLLNELMRSLGPGMLSSVAGGALTRVLGHGGGMGGSAPTVTAEQANQLTPQEVSEMAAHAEAKDPSLADRIGGFYAQHPDVVKALGGAALAIVLGRMANRNS